MKKPKINKYDKKFTNLTAKEAMNIYNQSSPKKKAKEKSK